MEGADTIRISSGSEVLPGGSSLSSEKLSARVVDGDSTSHSSAPRAEVAMANVNGIEASVFLSGVGFPMSDVVGDTTVSSLAPRIESGMVPTGAQDDGTADSADGVVDIYFKK